MRADESPLSVSGITGYAVNVPIATTCQPTKVCTDTCYAATGKTMWPDALRRQARVQVLQDAAPRAFARRVVEEYDRLGLSFLRWNGVGDLTEGAVEAINHIGVQRPDVVLWVVSRKPALAARIEEAPGVYLQFSLDRSSLRRRDEFLAASPQTSRFFFSYQGAPDESVPELPGVSVVYHHRYRPQEGWVLQPSDCPLNGATDCAGMCARCRRCFDGTAVAMRNAVG